MPYTGGLLLTGLKLLWFRGCGDRDTRRGPANTHSTEKCLANPRFLFQKLFLQGLFLHIHLLQLCNNHL